MALTKPIWIRPNLVSKKRGNRIERERREKERGRRRGRGREEEEEGEAKIKGLELYGFVWISCLDICLWVVGCRKPNPRMNLCMEIITNPFVSLGFCYERT